jgi:hypothetical protein
MEKRGYFFSMDAFMAIMIVIIGVILAASNLVTRPFQVQTLSLSQDFLNTMANTKLYELNDNDYQAIQNQKRNGAIINLDNTIMQQIGEYYFRDISLAGQKCAPVTCMNLSTEFLENFLNSTVPLNYDIRITIESMIVINNLTDPRKARNLILYKRIVNGIYKPQYGWGPYKVNITVWQKST